MDTGHQKGKNLPRINFGDFSEKLARNKRRTSTRDTVSTETPLCQHALPISCETNPLHPSISGILTNDNLMAETPEKRPCVTHGTRETYVSNQPSQTSHLSDTVVKNVSNVEKRSDSIPESNDTTTKYETDESPPSRFSYLCNERRHSAAKRKLYRTNHKKLETSRLSDYGFRRQAKSVSTKDDTKTSDHTQPLTFFPEKSVLLSQALICDPDLSIRDTQKEWDTDKTISPSLAILCELSTSQESPQCDITDNNMARDHAPLVSQSPTNTDTPLLSCLPHNTGSGITFGSFAGTNIPGITLEDKPGSPCLPPPIPDTPSRRAQKRHHDSGESGLTTPKRTRTAAEGMTNPQAKTPRETHYPLHDTQKVKGINHAPPVAKTSPKNRLKYKNTKHVPAVLIFPKDDVTQKSVSFSPSDPQSADTPVPFIHALSEDERKLWNRSQTRPPHRRN